MREFYRITNDQMEALEVYMDGEIREEVHFRFAPCTNEEFTVHVLLRGGISKETIEEVLNIDLEEIERTYMCIESIKDFMFCNNVINAAKIDSPGRELCTEPSEKGKEYRFYLNQYCDCLNTLRKENPEMGVLSDLQEEFPEIDYCFKSDHCFYTWMGEIL